MSDLEPIKKHQFGKHQDFLDAQKIILQIQSSILKTTDIKVIIKKYQPPNLVISTSSASAASELQLVKPNLLKKLAQYNISHLSITIS